MRPSVLVVVLLLFAAGCFGGSSSSGGPTRLKVVVHGINGSKPWHTTWTLRCSPAGGNHPAPKTSCAALSDLLARHAVPRRHCDSEGGGPWTTVRGTYAGKPLSLEYAEACATGKTGREGQAVGAYFAHG
jgi:subtilisin inhibitor-like